MMKAISKRTVFFFALVIFGVFPAVSLAAEADFCVSLGTLSSRLESAVTEREKIYVDARIMQEERWADALARSDASIRDSRSVWDTKANDIWSVLMGRASTAKERTAVDRFKADLDVAIAVRRASVDEALAAFRAKAAETLKKKDSSADQAILGLKVEMSTALTDAQKGCGNGEEPAVLRDRYVKALSFARADFAQALDLAKKNNDTLHELAVIRQTSIQHAVNDFNNAIEDALKKLKSEFPGA